MELRINRVRINHSRPVIYLIKLIQYKTGKHCFARSDWKCQHKESTLRVLFFLQTKKEYTDNFSASLLFSPKKSFGCAWIQTDAKMWHRIIFLATALVLHFSKVYEKPSVCEEYTFFLLQLVRQSNKKPFITVNFFDIILIKVWSTSAQRTKSWIWSFQELTFDLLVKSHFVSCKQKGLSTRFPVLSKFEKIKIWNWYASPPRVLITCTRVHVHESRSFVIQKYCKK